MNFDFAKFTNKTNEVSTAFGAKPQDVVESISKEIAIENGDMEIPDVDMPDVDMPEIPDVQEVNIDTQAKTITPEDIAAQAQFLKEQKAKSEAKETKSEKKETKSNKKDSKPKETKATPKKEEKEENIAWSRPRRVMAYGDEIYIENDNTKTLEDIRNTLVRQYGFTEFKDSKMCTMMFDAKTGDVYPHIQFNKKG